MKNVTATLRELTANRSASPTPTSTPARASARGGRGPSRIARSAQITTA